MTPEQIAALLASPEVKAAFGAIAAEQIKAAVPEITKPLADEVAALRKSALTPEAAKALLADLSKPAPGNTQTGGKTTNGQPDPNEAVFQALQARVEAAEAKAKEAERAARLKARDTDLSATLTASGIRPEVLPDLLAALPARGLVVEREDGSFGFKGRDQYDREVVMDLDAGVKAWAKSDAAAPYRPPVAAQGSGQGAGQTRSNTPAAAGGRINSLSSFLNAVGLNT